MFRFISKTFSQMSFWERLSFTSVFIVFVFFLRRWFINQRSLRSFSGQRVLITGGGSGLGAALARLLNSLGAELVLCGRNVERLETTVASLPRQDLPVRCLQLDLNEPQTIEQVLQELANEVQFQERNKTGEIKGSERKLYDFYVHFRWDQCTA